MYAVCIISTILCVRSTFVSLLHKCSLLIKTLPCFKGGIGLILHKKSGQRSSFGECTNEGHKLIGEPFKNLEKRNYCL